MSESMSVIYTARTPHEAHLLKNLLTEMGIPAMVENDRLEGAGLGVNVTDWTMQARVVVPEVHALLARQTALEFERKGMADLAAPTEPPVETPAASAEKPGDAWPEDDESTADMIVDAWPACPECDTKRTARCPICATTGNDFPPVDMGFVWIPGPVEEDETPGSSCGCGGGGCHSGKPNDRSVASTDGDELPEHAADPPATFICTMCDEPFVPEHASTCLHCGHVFPDGYEVEPPEAAAEKIDSRVMAVIAALGLVALAAAAYFIYLI